MAFGLFIAFGELLRLALPGGREAAPIAMVGGLAYALLLDLKSNHIPTPHSRPRGHRGSRHRHGASGRCRTSRRDGRWG